MRKIFSLSIFAFFCTAFFGLSFAAKGPEVRVGPTSHFLVSEQSSSDGKSDFWIAWVILRQPGWHTYWLHPGDVGIPPSVKWELPRGVSAGPLVFPPPKRVMMGKIGAHGHQGKTLFLSKISFSDEFEEVERFAIKGKAAWLACSRTCLPGYTDLEIEIPLGSKNLQDEEWSKDFETFRSQLPVDPSAGWLSKAKAFEESGKFRLVVPAEKGGVFPGLYFFGEGRTLRSNALQPVSQKPGKWELQLTRSDWSPKNESRLRGLLYRKDGWGGDPNCQFYRIDLPLL